MCYQQPFTERVFFRADTDGCFVLFLLEGAGGKEREDIAAACPLSVLSRCSDLLLSVTADVRSADDVIAFVDLAPRAVEVGAGRGMAIWPLGVRNLHCAALHRTPVHATQRTWMWRSGVGLVACTGEVGGDGESDWSVRHANGHVLAADGVVTSLSTSTPPPRFAFSFQGTWKKVKDSTAFVRRRKWTKPVIAHTSPTTCPHLTAKTGGGLRRPSAAPGLLPCCAAVALSTAFS